MAIDRSLYRGAVGRDMIPYIEAALKLGWRLERTKSNHYRLLSPDKKTIITLAGTGSYRTQANVAAMLRRHGVAV